VCGTGEVIHFALSGEAGPEIVRRTASETSEQRNHREVVGTGSAVSPVILCLSARGLGKTDPTIMPPSTVKAFPSRDLRYIVQHDGVTHNLADRKDVGPF
jgi:hypothetical protein